MENILKQFDDATDKLADAFVKKYFGKDYEYFWIGSQNKDREVLVINDYFFNLGRIVDALRYKATEKQLFGYQDKESRLAMEDKGMKVNFKNYIKYGNFNKTK